MKTLKGEYDNRQSPLVIKKDGDTLTGKAAANALIAQYKAVKDIVLSAKRKQEIKQAMQDNENQISEPIDHYLNIKVAMMEFEKALAQLNTKQAPGPDKVSIYMLKHLGPQAKKKLLQLFKASWKTSNIPKIWKKATMIPILKRGKCKTEAESYRPISLTFCICKLMERIIITRLNMAVRKKKKKQGPYAGTSRL